MKPKTPQVPESEQLELADLATGSSTLNKPTKAVAEAFADKLTMRFVRQFQKMRDPAMLQSGQDSGLKSVWDEICVQQQAFESVDWRAYERMIELTITVTVEELNGMDRLLLWEVRDWGKVWFACIEDDDEDEEGNIVPSNDVIVDMMKQRLLSVASDYTNTRIRKYLDRQAW